MFVTTHNDAVKNTSHKVVIPFYSYAALALLAANLLLFFSAESFTGHYFHPHILAITHAMALGWGTMIILGASHQLLPVLTESRLYSVALAYLSFAAAAAGIPLLLYGFYVFNMGWPARWGASGVVLIPEAPWQAAHACAFARPGGSCAPGAAAAQHSESSAADASFTWAAPRPRS